MEAVKGDWRSTALIWAYIVILIVVVLFALDIFKAFAEPRYEGQAITDTGEYSLFRASYRDIRSLATSRLGYQVEFYAFTDWGRKEIWYSSNKWRDHELHNASSYANLRKEARRDQERLQEARVQAMKRWLNATW